MTQLYAERALATYLAYTMSARSGVIKAIATVALTALIWKQHSKDTEAVFQSTAMSYRQFIL